MSEFADFENDLRVGDIGVEAWDGEQMRVVYMRFDNRSDMLSMDWDGIAEVIGMQHGVTVEHMTINEYRGAIGSRGVLASGGWRALALWTKPIPDGGIHLMWSSTGDYKQTKNYEQDMKRLFPWR